MSSVLVERLAELRAVVGYLGEREQSGWWQSSFYSTGSRAFLTPVFGRTPGLAQYAGASRAAALIHDERIGVGRVFHLFRLPEDLEQALYLTIQRPPFSQRITALVSDQQAARELLRDHARSSASAGVGPTEIGSVEQLREWRAWRAAAAQYLSAFEAGAQVFPYFTDRA